MAWSSRRRRRDSFGGSVARSKKGRDIWDSESARTVFKEMFSESLERCEGWDRENRLSYWNRSRFSTRKAGRKEGQAKGRKHAKQMVVE